MSNRTASRIWAKRAVTVTAVAAIATLGLAACSSNSSGGTSGGKKSYTLGFVVGASSDPFFQAMKVGAQAEATKLGDKLIFQGNATTYSPATQIPIVNQVLAEKPDGLALAPTDPVALQASVTTAHNSGIAVVNVDSRVNNLGDVISFITGDNNDGGTKAADEMAKAIGYTSGGSYQVVVGLTSATASTNVARLDGFKKEIAAKYPGIKIVATGYSQSNSTTADSNINNWLTEFPKLNGIFAIDGTNATGAAAALQAKGLTGKVALIGYDAYKTNVDLIAKGVFTALVAQNPAQEGKDAVDTLDKYLRAGKKSTGIQKSVTLPNILLDKDSSAADLQKYTYVQK
ncbi:MAG TPA: substrate-binding domain-containing protein [Galbitalea sp.]|jgi:ABC-type sugar transport system substrate-binding protein|nr:substrate-binding domain-containing protein [Galbitalea sp.]